MDPARTLTELQERDLVLVRLTKQLEDMPEKRSILQVRAKIAEIHALKQRTDAVIRSLDAGVKRFEDELQVVADKIDVEQAKLLSGQVKNPKELQAISMELDALKRRMEQLEAEMLDAMQKRETAGEQAAKVDAAVQLGDAKEAHLTEVFKERGSDLLAHIEAETAARTALLTSLPGDLRARYEAARQAKHGIAVGVLSDGMCSACRVGLPAGEIDTLENGPDISTCPCCGRILVVRGAPVE
jgi:predicted  nucleic acid-binding Zn-ribbon protein